MPRSYVTTPIYYVNDLPHIGHIYTTVVADIAARYRRMRGDEVYLLTGTDEHGQKIERAAEEKGLEPKALADQVVRRYHELWRELAISHDDFIRTTEDRHRRGVENLVARIEAAGDLYVARHEGWYCTSCEAFYTEKELAPGRLCPTHERAAERRAEENVFFRLSRYQSALLEHYERHPGFCRPETRANEMRAFIATGLRDLSVSRAGLTWGIPFPGHPAQTIYVWLDALTNYVSALGFGAADDRLYRRFWQTDGVERLHLVGKDILRFHAVYWPAFLLSAGLPLPDTVWAHGWWLRDARKMSKSTGNVVRPDDLIARFGPDALRYFLAREMVFGQDATFSDEAFVDRFNSDLANDLGNTVSRVVTLARRAYRGRTPPETCDDNPLIGVAREVAVDYRRAMDELAFQRALEALWRLLAAANAYLVEREPWKLARSEPGSARLARVLWNGLESTRITACGLLPFMPQMAPRILDAVGSPGAPSSLAALEWGATPTGAELPSPEPLFPRIDKEAYLEVAAEKVTGSGEARTGGSSPAAAGRPEPAGRVDGEAPRRQNGEEKRMITIDQFFQTELRVGTVAEARPIQGSEKLLELAVDLGDERRTVVAGIAREYRPEDLVGRQVVLVANLKPAKLMGTESQGMVLAAEVEGRAVLVHPAEPVPDGSPVK